MTLDLISRAEALRAARTEQLEQWKALQQKAPGMIATIGDKITRLDEFLWTARQLASIGDDEFSAALADVAKVEAPTDAQPVQRSIHISDHPAGCENEVAATQSTAARKDVQRAEVSGVEEGAEVASAGSVAGTQVPPVDTQTSKPVEPPGSAASSKTLDPVTLTDQIAPKPTLKDRIVALHAQHSDWTARQAAEHLGAKVNSVTGYSSMLRLKWGEKAQPELAPGPGHHTPAAAAIDADNEPVDIPAVRRPKLSERFYVRDAVGRYVHQSLDPSPTDSGPLMTAKRVYAWFPNEQQFKNALGRWPELAKLRKEVPEK